MSEENVLRDWIKNRGNQKQNYNKRSQIMNTAFFNCIYKGKRRKGLEDQKQYRIGVIVNKKNKQIDVEVWNPESTSLILKITYLNTEHFLGEWEGDKERWNLGFGAIIDPNKKYPKFIFGKQKNKKK